MEFESPESTTGSQNDDDIKVIPAYILVLTGVSCTLSILGACFIFFTYFMVSRIRNFTRKLLLFLTAADLITAFGYLLGLVRYIIFYVVENNASAASGDSVCVFQSFLTTFSSMASFFWTVIIGIYIYVSAGHQSAVLRSEGWHLTFHVLSWGIPGTVTLIALYEGALGGDFSVGTGAWCWIRSYQEKREQIMWMFLTGKGWELLCYLLLFAFLVVFKYQLFRQRQQEELYPPTDNPAVIHDIRGEDRNYMYVWLVLYVLRFWGTIRFLISISVKNETGALAKVQLFFQTLQSLGDSGQAFWNFVILCIGDHIVRDAFRERFCPRTGEVQPLLN